MIIPHNTNEKDLRFLRVYDEEFNKSSKWILINKIKSDTKSIIGIQIRLDLINQCIYVDKENRKAVETLIWPSITSLRTYLKINGKIFIDRNELGKIVNYSKDIIKVSLSGKVMDFSIHEAFLSRYLKLETKKENQKFLDYLRHSANHRAISYNLIESANIIDHAQCTNCSAQLTYKSHFMNSNGQLFDLDMFYCSHCEKYYILKDHYANNQKIYNACCKCIEIKDPLQNNSEEQMVSIEYFYDRQVNHARFGFARLVKCKNNSVYVSFHGNAYVFDFPDCFEKRDLVFTNKKVQIHMMSYIAFCKKDKKIKKINPISNKLTIQHTSYIDMRRITGLTYKIQLIGSSNNHATRHHPVEDVVVKLAYKAPKSKSFDVVSISMHYCSQCKKYFDIKQSFLQQIEKAHLDIHNFAVSFESESGLPIEFKQMNLKEYSKLKLFGYSVGANGLNTSSRHDLINFLLDKHLMTASEIKSHLQFNIRYIGNKPNMENAVGDWKNDINYVNDYIRNGKIH